MAVQDEVELPIVIDDTEAVKSIKKIDSSLDSLADTFKGVAAGFLAFEGFKLGADIFKDAIGEAAEAEQNIRNLNIALANVGELSQSNSQDVQDFATAIADVTTVTDDAALKLFTMATNVGLTKDQSKLATQAAINLSAATGKDLDASLKAVTDTLSGQSGKLSKVIPQLKNLTEEELKAGKGIDIVAKQFDGFAQAATGTFGGATTQAKNSLGELLETLGGVVVQNPVVIEAIKLVTSGIKSFTDTLDKNKDTLKEFVSDVIIGLVGSFRVLIDFVKPVVYGIQAIVNGFILFDANLRAIDSAIYAFVNETIGSLIDGFNRVIGLVAGVARDMLTLAKAVPGASTAFEALGINIDDAEKALDGMSNDGLKSVSGGLKSLADASKKASEDAIKLTDAFDGGEEIAAQFDNTLSDFENQLGKTQAKLILTKREVTDLTNGLKNGVAPAKELTYILSELAKGTFEKLKGQLESITDENDKLTKSARELIVIQKDKADKLAGYAAEELQYLKDTKKLTDEQYQENLKVVEAYKQQADERQRLANIKVTNDNIADIGNTIGQGIAQGAAGASNVIVKLGGKFIESIAPGFGAIAETFLAIFAKGPEATKAFVRDFVKAIPEIIVAIAESAPAFVEALLDELINKGGAIKIALSIYKAYFSLLTGGEVGKKMAGDFLYWVQDGFVKIGNWLASLFTKFIPQAFSGVINFFSSFSFSNAFSGVANFLSGFKFPSLPTIKINTPTWLNQLSNFITNLFKTPFWINQAENFIHNLYNWKFPSFSTGSGSGGNGTLADLGHSIGLASGGTIPNGYPNDSFGPVSLQSGEMVVPDKDVKRLNDFLNRQDSGNSLESSLLNQILSALNQPVVVQSNVNLNGQTFANIVLNLSRTNQRLTA